MSRGYSKKWIDFFIEQNRNHKRKCLEADLSQGEFDKLYEVSKNTVRRWENGAVRMSKRLWKKIFKSGIE